MKPIQPFADSIQAQIGRSQLIEEDYSFLQPGGNDHLVQFLFNLIPDTYEELDLWDRNNFLLMDIAAEIDLDFSLDEDGHFATSLVKGARKAKNARIILDLRDKTTSIAYFYGDSKVCVQLNQKVCRCSRFERCFIDTEMMRTLVPSFEQTNMARFYFEQFRTIFLSPIVVKGIIQGAQTRDLIKSVIDEGKEVYNIDSIGGFLSDGARGEVILDAAGFIQADSCRLSEFLHFVESAYMAVCEKYARLAEHAVTGIDEVFNTSLIKTEGGSIEYRFPFSIDKSDGLASFLVKGNRDLQFLGTSERLSRKLWRIQSTERESGIPIELEVSSDFIRIYLSSKEGIPLLDKIEAFLRRHVSPNIDRLTY